jgi:glycosyltransferase involved in cell wall biosynthesis
LPRLQRALFLTPETPYPLTGGGALRSASVLEYLGRSYVVDAVIFREPGAKVELPSGRVDRLHIVDLPAHSKRPASRLLRNGGRLLRRVPPLVDRFSGFGAAIDSFLRSRPTYDLGVVEHFWCAPYWEQIGARCRSTVLDLHNLESAWHGSCGAVADWPDSLAHGVFSRAALDLERRWLPRYSLLLATSEQDAGRVRRVSTGAAVAVYPNTIPLVDCPRREEEDVIAFSGTLEYEPNRTAVRYFAREIWPALRRQWPALKWRLVGRNPEAVEQFVHGDSRVERTGPVDDAIAHLSAAKVAVVPLLSGSGTRLKIVEAWAAGTAVVSTSLGAEGLPARSGENILLADSPVDFGAAVSGLLGSVKERQRIGRAGRDRYESELTWSSAWTVLDCELARLG